MADDLNKLLTYIVEHPLREAQSREAEIDASAVQDVAAEIEAVTGEETKAAERLAPYFAKGLRMAASRSPLVVEDTSVEGGMIAEAFARYLVAPSLAASQSVELPNNGFRYTFEVNWDILRATAQQAGVNLDTALHASE